MNRRMKMTSVAMIALTVLLGASLAKADSIVAGDIIRITADPNRDISYAGGAFLMAEKTGANTFGPAVQTFCLELNERIGFGATYLVDSVSKAAVNGGNAGGSPDPMSQETAWLYMSFRFGALAHPAGSTVTQQQRGIQEAIWFLEQEITTIPAAGYAGYYHNLAMTAPLAAKQFAYSQVFVVNPVTLDSLREPRQSLLELVPEPGSLLMLGSGLLGLAALGLRRRK